MTDSGHEGVHHDVVAETSAHHEQVEDLMGAEVTVFLVEDRQLQGVDHAAHGVDDATRQKPSEGLGAEGPR